MQWAAENSGIPQQQIVAVAEEFATAKPATIWIGYGLQRHVNGGATVRSIDALAAMTGNVGKTGAAPVTAIFAPGGLTTTLCSRSAPRAPRGL
ncbi:MAG: molybdopterin-dependent oxidoreductase [Desulfobacterales bacterium]|nr:molybdopterin-dependent oxidoreductase [Desulfobacterales bacterium]MBS3755627.1 molybdopterin-dependent oxidoreductase [Desulfobacterales bacterium]